MSYIDGGEGGGFSTRKHCMHFKLIVLKMAYTNTMAVSVPVNKKKKKIKFQVDCFSGAIYQYAGAVSQWSNLPPEVVGRISSIPSVCACVVSYGKSSSLMHSAAVGGFDKLFIFAFSHCFNFSPP